MLIIILFFYQTRKHSLFQEFCQIKLELLHLKQKIGLNDCVSRQIERQKAHIYLCFQAFTQLQPLKYTQNNKNIDEIVNKLRKAKLNNPDLKSQDYNDILTFA